MTKKLGEKLKIRQEGSGKPLVVLHGWGLNSAVWQPIRQHLIEQFEIYWVDLPGHGINADISLLDVKQAANLLELVLPDGAHVLGWSLGGLIAQQLAVQCPDKVKSLVLIASNRSFVQRENWQSAMPADVLDTFANNLQDDLATTLKRFLALQFMGVKGGKAQVKSLQESLLEYPPNESALNTGLDMLKNADFLNTELNCHTHWILGKLDRLVPVSLADVLEGLLNNTVDIIDKAGHAPFISHPDECVANILKGFQHV